MGDLLPWIKTKFLASRRLKRLRTSFGESSESNFNESNEGPSDQEIEQLKKKGEYLDILMTEVKIRVTSAKTNKEKIQLLTLKPYSWTVTEAAEFFNIISCKQLKNINEKMAYLLNLLPKPGREFLMKQ